jgi:hypothetical protein
METDTAHLGPAKEKAEEPLPRTTCSRSFLEMRWYDKQWDKWTEWEEVEGFKLREKYGTTPEEWKASCKIWIEVGGHYEYRIGTRTDVVEWEISYRENKEISGGIPSAASTCSPSNLA